MAGSGTGNTGMIVAITVIIVLVIVASIIGFFVWRKCSSKTSSVDSENDHNQNGPKHIPSSSVSSSLSPDITDNDHFQDQYHPKAEFGNIFGRKDPFSKTHDADHVIDEDDEEDHNHQAHQPVPTDHNDFHTKSPEKHMDEDTPMHMQNVIDFSGLDSIRSEQHLKFSNRHKNESHGNDSV